MSAAGQLLFSHNRDVKVAVDPAGNLFSKGPLKYPADGHGGLTFRFVSRPAPVVSIKASADPSRDGVVVSDNWLPDISPLPTVRKPVLLLSRNQVMVQSGYEDRDNTGCIACRRKVIAQFGARKNAAKTYKVERDNLRDAFLELQKRSYPGRQIRANIPGAPPPGGVTFWFKQDEIHQATHVHALPNEGWRGIAFLPWHREMVNRLEDLLRQVDPTVSLHYWDWKTDPTNGHGTNLMTADFMGSANGDAGEPWLSGGFYNPTPRRAEDGSTASTARDDADGFPFDPPRSLTRAKQSGAPANAAAEANVVNRETFPEMRAALENLHNNAHGYIGGTLGNPHESFRDPFVFLLHSNVDRLWASWQLKPGKAWRLDPAQVYGTESNTDLELGASVYDPGILTPLDPWAGNPTKHSEVRRIRPWAAPENEQVSKTSKDPSIVMPRRYLDYV